jgi:hypothetical protein
MHVLDSKILEVGAGASQTLDPDRFGIAVRSRRDHIGLGGRPPAVGGADSAKPDEEDSVAQPAPA